MRLLLDTHIAVWTALDPGALTAAERSQMEAADTQLVLSAVAVWELRLKWHSLHISGERKGPLDPAVVVAFAKAMDWELLPLTPGHAAARLAQPLPHKATPRNKRVGRSLEGLGDSRRGMIPIGWWDDRRDAHCAAVRRCSAVA